MSDYVIGRRQLYILPTRIGWYFCLILLALFAIAIKYDNQAAFMMLFLLVSIGIIGMHYTHNNVIGLTISSGSAKPVFVGDTAQFPIKVSNFKNKERQAIWIICAGYHRVFDIDIASNNKIMVDLPTINRGLLNCPEITLSSQFPLGIFFCWSKRFQITESCVVYPQPLNLVSIDDNGDNINTIQTNASTSIYSNNTDYSGMKPYQPGDRPRDIHWPSFAKTHKLITIQHENKTSNSLNFSWHSLPAHLSVEDRLSQLCFWVIEADKTNTPYQLEMPNRTIQFNNGNSHFHECLSLLALWGQK